MHSENKERDDTVVPTSSTLLQITEKGTWFICSILKFFWLVFCCYWLGGFFLFFVFKKCCFFVVFFEIHRIKQEMAVLNLLHHGEKTECELVQMHILQKGELRHLASSL